MIIPIVLWNNDLHLENFVKLGYFGDVFLKLADLVAANKELVPLSQIDCQIGVFTDIENLEELIGWLDKGASKAVFDFSIEKETINTMINFFDIIPRERLTLSVTLAGVSEDPDFFQTALVQMRKCASTVIIKFAADIVFDDVVSIVESLQQSRGKEGEQDFLQLIVQGPAWTPEQVGQLHGMKPQVDCLVEAFIARSEDPPAPPTGPIDAASAFIACARTDRPDGLYTTVVTDERGVALGLVYSNAESIRASLECGRGVYWSRSRGGLWRKGDTSGAWQELVSVSLDCDSDAICFTVIQHGNPPAFCHLNRRTCWSADKGFGKLERTLKSRLEDAPEGSYTKRLFNDSELLRNKLLEEAQELIEAETPAHIASEAADLMYFLVTRCVAGGVSLKDIEKDLDMKSRKLKRRPGNAKAARIAEAAKVLGQTPAQESAV